MLRTFVLGFGILALAMLVLGFTDVPYYAYYHLGTGFPLEGRDPDLIVVMGGSGMPSPDGLMRAWYGAEAALEYEKATVILALPANETDSTRQLDLMAGVLVDKGVDPRRINYESRGYNTRTQAINIAAMNGERQEHTRVLVVTSPEHIYRSVKCFKKAGFDNVFGFPTFECPSDEDSLLDKKGRKQIRPTLDLRYNIWSYLHYELTVIREYLAISYYGIMGWV